MEEWVKNVNELEFLRNLAGKQQEINDANSRLEEMARSSATSTAEDPNKLFNVPDARAAATVGPEAMVAANSGGQVGRQIEYNPSIVDKSAPDLNNAKVLDGLVKQMAQEYYRKLEKEGQRFGSPNSATDGATAGNRPAAPQGMGTPDRTAPPPPSSGGGSRYYEENTGSPAQSGGRPSGTRSNYYEENSRGGSARGSQPVGSSNPKAAPKKQVGITRVGSEKGKFSSHTPPRTPDPRKALDVNQPNGWSAGELMDYRPLKDSLKEKALGMLKGMANPMESTQAGRMVQGAMDSYNLVSGNWEKMSGYQSGQAIKNQAKAAYNGDPEALQSFMTDGVIATTAPLAARAVGAVRADLNSGPRRGQGGGTSYSKSSSSPPNPGAAPSGQKYSAYKDKFENGKLGSRPAAASSSSSSASAPKPRSSSSASAPKPRSSAYEGAPKYTVDPNNLTAAERASVQGMTPAQIQSKLGVGYARARNIHYNLNKAPASTGSASAPKAPPKPPARPGAETLPIRVKERTAPSGRETALDKTAKEIRDKRSAPPKSGPAALPSGTNPNQKALPPKGGTFGVTDAQRAQFAKDRKAQKMGDAGAKGNGQRFTDNLNVTQPKNNFSEPMPLGPKSSSGVPSGRKSSGLATPVKKTPDTPIKPYKLGPKAPEAKVPGTRKSSGISVKPPQRTTVINKPKGKKK
jgi:hypothetical protein